MLEQIEKSNHKSKKIIPKGCYEVEHVQKYIQIKNFIQIKDMYNIVTPFRYQYMSYVIANKKDPKDGQILEIYHQASRKCILKAIPKRGQIGCKYVINCANTDKVVARLRGDLMNSKFHLFDGGNNPNKKKFPSRKELAYIYTVNNQFFSQKPPVLAAILANHVKRLPQNNQIQSLGTLYEAQGVLQIESGVSQLLKAQKQNRKRTFSVSSVEPIFCPTKKCYTMDLKGLISEPSSTNMVLKTATNQDCVVMGKRSENTYLMFVGNPLTLVQSLGIFLVNYINRKQ